jgi:predicted GIY-YIG superfamily endonuclease
MNNNYIIYLLYNTNSNYTYVGITNNPNRRIRQHNGELVGGAKYTKLKKGEGEWKYFGWIQAKEENILEKRPALSLEKKIQIHSRKSKGKTPIERRINTINKLLEGNNILSFNKFLEENNLLSFNKFLEETHNTTNSPNKLNSLTIFIDS